MLFLLPLLVGSAYGSGLVPPEVICRQGEFVVRAVKFNLEWTNDDEKLSVFLKVGHNTWEHVQHRCSDTSMLNEVEFNLRGRYGFKCYKDGVKFYYRDLGISGHNRFRMVRIRGMNLLHGLSYPLITPGLIDLERMPETPQDGMCINIEEPTSFCYRSTGQACFPNSARCAPRRWETNDDNEFECVCRPGFRSSTFGGPCLDINECAEDEEIGHICGDDDGGSTCRNLNGSYWCERNEDKMISSQKNNSCSITDDQVNLGNLTDEYCVPKDLVIPSEVFCKVSDRIETKLIFPEKPFTYNLPYVSLVWSDDQGNSHVRTVHDVVCDNDSYTALPPELMTPQRPYEFSAVTAVDDGYLNVMNDVVERGVLLSSGRLQKVGVRCFSNALFVWMIDGVKLIGVQVGGTDVDVGHRIRINYHGDTRRRPTTVKSCGRAGVSDFCYLDDNGSCDRATQVCESDGTFVSCQCKPEFPDCKNKPKACEDGLDGCVNNDCLDTPCGDDEHCKHFPGQGYKCMPAAEDCSLGFRFANRTCVDVDECAEGTDACERQSTDCVNTEGGYRCACKDRRQSLTTTLTSCRMQMYQYRLLRHIRCCSHRHNTFFLVKGLKGGIDEQKNDNNITTTNNNNNNNYVTIVPEACLDVSTIDHALVPWMYSRPYVVRGDGDLEVEALLELVDMYRVAKKKDGVAAVIYFADGCRRTYTVGSNNNNNNATVLPKVYISYAPPTKNYFDPMDSFMGRTCRNRLGTNVEWLKKQFGPIPEALSATNYTCESSNLTSLPLWIQMFIMSWSFLL